MIPGPFCALAMRFWLRNESLPICFLAPSDVKSSMDVVVAVLILVDDDVDDDLNEVVILVVEEENGVKD